MLQRHIFTVATHESHGGVRVSVYQTGKEDVIRPFMDGVRGVEFERVRSGDKRKNPPLMDGQAEVFAHGDLGFDRDRPARANQSVDALTH